MGKNMGKSPHPKTHKPYEFLNKELEGRVYSPTNYLRLKPCHQG